MPEDDTGSSSDLHIFLSRSSLEFETSAWEALPYTELLSGSTQALSILFQGRKMFHQPDSVSESLSSDASELLLSPT